MTPLVSICMHHLNSQPFTGERIKTILDQTWKHWELIVVDSQSDDGSLEILQRYAATDQRIKISQGPRDGALTNLNRTLERCSGEYVYIATADDTMTPDCIEAMVTALEQNPDCGVCHCCLEIIDENGRAVTGEERWENRPVPQYFGHWLDTPHIRKAPHDGMLYFGLNTVYTSLTQLLIRRRVFDELGLFSTDFGSHGDFEWGMRISLSENVIHIPRHLATWRQHSKQATQSDAIFRLRARGEFQRMIRRALESLSTRNPALGQSLKKSRLNDFALATEVGARRTTGSSAIRKILAVIPFVLVHPGFCVRWLFACLILRRSLAADFDIAVRKEFARLQLKDLLKPIENLAVHQLPAGSAMDSLVT